VVQKLIEQGKNPGNCKVLVKGITFKEDVADIRNSKVVDMIKELMSFSLNVHTIDPWASANEVAHEYGISLIETPIGTYDAIVLAVGHKEYKVLSKDDLQKLSNGEVLLFDIKGILKPETGDFYWKL
jgi:UDP-N-acetyl-D-galactosamine dehydrogenase